MTREEAVAGADASEDLVEDGKCSGVGGKVAADLCEDDRNASHTRVCRLAAGVRTGNNENVLVADVRVAHLANAQQRPVAGFGRVFADKLRAT